MKKLAVLILLAPIHAFALETDNAMDVVEWQAANPKKHSIMVKLTGKQAVQLLDYTHAEGPIFIETMPGTKVDDKCQVIPVKYTIMNVAKRDGTVAPKYEQLVPTPYCFGGGLPKLGSPRPDDLYDAYEASGALPTSPLKPAKK